MFLIPLVRLPWSARWWKCAECGARITDDDFVIQINGKPAQNSFSNPGGESFEVLTFSSAFDIVQASSSFTEHSWFEGYSWRPVACGRCGKLLGWQYEATSPGIEPRAFFGLIVGSVMRDAGS